MTSKEFPKISIVTPSYNQGQFIEQTIRSILDQNYPNLEYVIIDGGSTDETVEIIKRYEDQLYYWVSEKDEGQSHAINKGLEKCNGDIFNWVNSDDYLEPNSLWTIANAFKEKPFSAYCGQVNVIDDTVFSHVRKPSYLGRSVEDSIANFNINQEGTWWSLSVVKELKGVNEGFQYTMDLDLWINALNFAPFESFQKTDIILSNYRRHVDAKSTINSKMSFLEDPFRKEEFFIFDKLLPQKVGFLSYFEGLKVLRPDYTLELETSKLEEISKTKITELYLFKLLKLFYYSNDYKRAKKCIFLLNKLGSSQYICDRKYFKKKIAINNLLFWR